MSLETPFPLYRKGVPKAGLDDVTQWLLAGMLAAIPYLFITMVAGQGSVTSLIGAAIAYATFRFGSVPLVRHVYQRLPPRYPERYRETIFMHGGLLARPDPEPTPFKVK